MDKALKSAIISLFGNATFALYYIVLGIAQGSWWFLTLGAYYLVLSIVRFSVIALKAKEAFVTKLTGWMLILLSIPLIKTVELSAVSDRGYKLHMIIMIAMAAYAFTKITVAAINLIKCRRSNSAILIALRNVSLADAFASIFALQRSMLVSFEGMTENEIVIMNLSLGSAVCIIVFLLGLNLIKKKSQDHKTEG